MKSWGGVWQQSLVAGDLNIHLHTQDILHTLKMVCVCVCVWGGGGMGGGVGGGAGGHAHVSTCTSCDRKLSYVAL